ncbi:MAG: hypothetical protein QOG43_181 [Actinomycetota bacterium]|jgi:hypothetical protein|nr:hypothetical protein [Actinomycetota bacterium]
MNKTFHLSLKQRIPMTLAMVPMLVALAVDGMLSVATVLLLTLVAIVSIRSSGRFGVTLTAQGVRAEGLRSRFFPWSAIREIRTERMLGSRFVVLVSNRGRTRLRAPISGFLRHDSDFDDKYADVVSWWRAHRD